MTDTPTSLDALEALLAKATPGNYRVSGAKLDGFAPIMAPGGAIIAMLSTLSGQWKHDADAIVALHNAAPALIAKARRVEKLEAALRDLLHAVCHETGFAAAVRQDSGLAYPWEPLDIAEAQARAALKENTDG